MAAAAASSTAAALVAATPPTGDFWAYRAEGAANVAIAYAGPAGPLSGHLLRVRKGGGASRRVATGDSEALRELFPADPLAFALGVVRPLLGDEYVIPGAPLRLPRRWLAELVSCTVASYAHRPHHRRRDIDFGVGVGSEDDVPALLMLDHSTLPPCGHAACPSTSLCVEIKPKCGILPSTTHVAGGASLPCRFCQHQLWKVLTAASEGGDGPAAAAAGALLAAASALAREWLAARSEVLGLTAGGDDWQSDAALWARSLGLLATPSSLAPLFHSDVRVGGSPLSEYCPTALFGGDADEKARAIARLVHAPHNNLRVFADGRLVFSAELAAAAAACDAPCVGDSDVRPGLSSSAPLHPGGCSAGSSAWALLDVALAAVDPALFDGGGGGTSGALALAQLVARVLDVDGLLPRLLALQDCDGGAGPGAALRAADRLRAGSSGADDADVVRRYLLAMTARDCSLLLVMRRCEEADSGHAAGSGSRAIVLGDEHGARRISSLPLPDGAHAPSSPEAGDAGAGGASPPSPAARRLTYSLAVVDVDAKSPYKLPQYVEQELALAICCVAAWAVTPVSWRGSRACLQRGAEEAAGGCGASGGRD